MLRRRSLFESMKTEIRSNNRCRRFLPNQEKKTITVTVAVSVTTRTRTGININTNVPTTLIKAAIPSMETTETQDPLRSLLLLREAAVATTPTNPFRELRTIAIGPSRTRPQTNTATTTTLCCSITKRHPGATAISARVWAWSLPFQWPADCYVWTTWSTPDSLVPAPNRKKIRPNHHPSHCRKYWCHGEMPQNNHLPTVTITRQERNQRPPPLRTVTIPIITTRRRASKNHRIGAAPRTTTTTIPSPSGMVPIANYFHRRSNSPSTRSLPLAGRHGTRSYVDTYLRF
mmetsp:Transcript_3849/g.6827  ORF Transcript_3849/g.6827 Transcript_3849/m.6827 type:complete len:288 (+) Transcript_3849:896-1759(+)